MCERKTEDPPGLSDEQVKSLIAITREVTIATTTELMIRVLRCVMIDDREQRLATAMELLTRFEGGQQPRVN